MIIDKMTLAQNPGTQYVVGKHRNRKHRTGKTQKQVKAFV